MPPHFLGQECPHPLGCVTEVHVVWVGQLVLLFHASCLLVFHKTHEHSYAESLCYPSKLWLEYYACSLLQGLLFPVTSLLYWIDRARVSADEHIPILFRILFNCVDPPQLSIASVIRVWKGKEHRSSVQNISAERQNRRRTCFTWYCSVCGWLALVLYPCVSEIVLVIDFMKAHNVGSISDTSLSMFSAWKGYGVLRSVAKNLLISLCRRELSSFSLHGSVVDETVQVPIWAFTSSFLLICVDLYRRWEMNERRSPLLLYSRVPCFLTLHV